MTNRTTPRPYSAGTAIKRPRLRRLEILFDGPPPNTPEGVNNGTRPHGGYRGMKQQPPGQFTYDKDEQYVSELNDEYKLLVNNEKAEQHGAPYWVSGVQREITHSGESPLFTNKLFPTGKFEQLHGCVSLERALLRSRTKRVSSPRRRHVTGVRQFYRPNSTHQYLSATDLRTMQQSEEGMVKYGRPTRTTLLRARQRSNSAPVNAYDLRRENTKRIEEAKNNTVFCTSKDSFEREQTQISSSNRGTIEYASSLDRDETPSDWASHPMYNVYATDGETMHSFLTGARYNRAHLLDSRGLTVYGVYMPRDHPSECFMAANRRNKDDDVPSAPPDSPRSDIEESVTETIITRPMSGVVHYRPITTVRPVSSKATPTSKPTSSRPQSNRITSSKSPGSRPRSGKDSIASSAGQSTRSFPPKSADSNRREPLPDEITMAMPDHINKTGRGGVYVTLKGQKMLETVESKLPRVTGVSLPKIRKSRDLVDEMAIVNQPPPTPTEPSMAGGDKIKQYVDNYEETTDAKDAEAVQRGDTAEDIDTDNPREANINATENTQVNVNEKDTNREIIDLNISKLTVSKNEIIDKETVEIGPTKHVNFSDNEVTVITENEANQGQPEVSVGDDGKQKPDENKAGTGDNVKFFVTEEAGEIETPRNVNNESAIGVKAHANAIKVPSSKDEGDETEVDEKDDNQAITVEISETEKSQ